MIKKYIEDIKKWDEDDHVFYRYQCKDWEVGEESWGMIYNNREEAIEDYMDMLECSYEEAEEEAILPGKSCMPTFKEILNFSQEFGEDFYLLVFEGADTRVTGHDGEYVANFYEEIDRIEWNDIDKIIEEIEG